MEKTVGLIVDSYHYITIQVTDYLYAENGCILTTGMDLLQIGIESMTKIISLTTQLHTQAC